MARLIPAAIDDSTPQSERDVLHVFKRDPVILCEVHKAKSPEQLYVAASRGKHVLYYVEEAPADAQAVLP